MSEIRVDNITNEAGTGTPAFPFGLPRSVQIFDTPGSSTWNPPAGINSIMVIVVGGGGGGGGIRSSSETDRAGASSSGGGGGYAIKLFTGVSETSGSVQVASGGTAGSGRNSGNNGGTSSFSLDGTTVTCSGGSGGADSAQGIGQAFQSNSPGGTASGGDINITGSASGSAFSLAPVLTSDNALGASGLPGYTPFGPGAKEASSNGDNNYEVIGEDSPNPGGGGSGTVVGGQSNSDLGAGNGGDGIVIVWEFA